MEFKNTAVNQNLTIITIDEGGEEEAKIKIKAVSNPPHTPNF